jgi:hypothetical protein
VPGIAAGGIVKAMATVLLTLLLLATVVLLAKSYYDAQQRQQTIPTPKPPRADHRLGDLESCPILPSPQSDSKRFCSFGRVAGTPRPEKRVKTPPIASQTHSVRRHNVVPVILSG